MGVQSHDTQSYYNVSSLCKASSSHCTAAPRESQFCLLLALPQESSVSQNTFTCSKELHCLAHTVSVLIIYQHFKQNKQTENRKNPQSKLRFLTYFRKFDLYPSSSFHMLEQPGLQMNTVPFNVNLPVTSNTTFSPHNPHRAHSYTVPLPTMQSGINRLGERPLFTLPNTAWGPSTSITLFNPGGTSATQL